MRCARTFATVLPARQRMPQAPASNWSSIDVRVGDQQSLAADYDDKLAFADDRASVDLLLDRRQRFLNALFMHLCQLATDESRRSAPNTVDHISQTHRQFDVPTHRKPACAFHSELLKASLRAASFAAENLRKQKRSVAIRPPRARQSLRWRPDRRNGISFDVLAAPAGIRDH